MTLLRSATAISLALAAVLALGASATAGARARPADPAVPYVPGEVVVGYAPRTTARTARAVATTMGVRAAGPLDSDQQVLHIPAGESVQAAVTRLRHARGVLYAVPNIVGHTSGAQPGLWIPNDPGFGTSSEGWRTVQWNFRSGAGVSAPGAWANLRADHRPGGKGVVVAIVDTGVAYRRWKKFRRSPDFNRTHFVHPYDFISHNRYPLDRNGHGTFVAGTVAESTNNGIGLTGLAYGATIMPVRVLNADGWGDAATISQGIRYAVNHHAQVINLSLEFDPSVTSSEIPEMISALQYARRHNVVVVAASGNDGNSQMAYPARAPDVISVGATTKDRCLAEYSNTDRHLDLVAPGGGPDSSVVSDPHCHPYRSLPGIHQMTFGNPNHPQRFGFPNDWFGTSMSAAHVAGVAALVIASGVLGRHPTPGQVLSQLEATAEPLGHSQPNPDYGYGLVNAAAATTFVG